MPALQGWLLGIAKKLWAQCTVSQMQENIHHRHKKA
jgi:hypothetical protein